MSPFNYQTAWKQVEEFSQQGLPQSALQLTNEIYEHAKRDNNASQLVKAVIHILKFTDYREEGAFVKNINTVRNEIESAGFPAKPVLHSMLGEMYWQYYQQNRYVFYERTKTLGSPDGDIETWDLARIVEETFRHYDLSLQDAAQAKQVQISSYEEVLNPGSQEGRNLRPTLFDFLAHRALNFFMSEEPNLIKPQYTFSINNEDYLKPADEFVKLSIVTEDDLSMKQRALGIFQELLLFHREREDVEAVTDVDLRRLFFVRQHMVHPLADSIYRNTLEHLEKSSIEFPISTKVTHALANSYYTSASRYNPLKSDAHQWEYKKAYEICDRALARFENSDGAISCGQLQYAMAAKSLSADVEEYNIPDKPFRVSVTYKNTDSLYYRIVPTTRDEITSLRKALERKHSDYQKLFLKKYLEEKTSIKSGFFRLPDDQDYHSHRVEVKMDPLPSGEYMLIFSANEDFSLDNNGLAYSATVVTNIAFIHRVTKEGALEFFVVDRDTGVPMPQVKAEIFASVYNNTTGYEQVSRGTWISDDKGYLKVPYADNDKGGSLTVNFSKGNNVASTESINRYSTYSYGSLSQYRTNEATRRTQTSLFLDRAIYRPGQTIYFKGIVIETDGKNPKIKSGHKAVVTLFDVNYQKKSEIEVVSNEWGTFSGSFTAPSDGLMGRMSLQTDGGHVSFSVEEYKRPKFEVMFEPVTGSYQLNDSVTISGIARAYSGANIDGASARYRIVRRVRFPFWWWRFRGYYPHVEDMEIANGVTSTDPDGRFHITFRAIPDLSVDKSADPTFVYVIYADITDINGETHSTEGYVSVGYKALQVSVPIDMINKDSVSKKEIHIHTSNLAGSFQPASGEIKIFRLKSPDRPFRKRLWPQPDKHIYSREEYYKLFPYDLYADEENKYLWPVDNEVLSFNFNTETSRTFALDVDKWPVGEYMLEVKAFDKNGEEVKEVSFFPVIKPSANSNPRPMISSLLPVRMHGEPGTIAAFSMRTDTDKLNVLYEWELDGNIIHQQRVILRDAQRLFEIPIQEEYRGNLGVHLTFVKHNRLYFENLVVIVPYTNKELDITFETFRNKLLPGEQEEWRLRLRGHKGEKVAAEMVAALYDASLDEFASNSFYAQFYSSRYNTLQWSSQNGFINTHFAVYAKDWNPVWTRYVKGITYDALNWFGYNFYYYAGRRHRSMAKKATMDVAGESYDKEYEMVAQPSAAPLEEVANDYQETPVNNQMLPVSKDSAAVEDLSAVKVRTNFNETAFFYPHLTTNEEGDILIKFTIPEALTRWKMLGFAHTKDLASGYAYNQLITQKDLMVVPNQPRFFRENDTMLFTAKVNSLVDEALNGTAQLEFFDALTMKPLQLLAGNVHGQQSFSLAPRRSTTVSWSIQIPEGLQAIAYRIVAKSGEFSDGEEMVLPVVTNRMLVTESLPLPIRGMQSKQFTFNKLQSIKSSTLKHHRYTLEFTSQPAWYAVQALPYLMEYPYECVEQTFSRYYANSIASHIANSRPKIKKVFDTWRNLQPDALLSNLEKNQALKSSLLEETPWVLQAQDETQRKRMLGVLFDLNRMANEQERSISKILTAQNSNGSFSWFPGGPDDQYMTQHIVAGLGHLRTMGIQFADDDGKIKALIENAVAYMDNKVKEDYERLKVLAKEGSLKLEENHISYAHFHYLYVRSYFRDIEVSEQHQESFRYFLSQAEKYWLQDNIYLEGMASLALFRFGREEVTKAMIKSFSERALHSEEMGMYWKYERGYYWYQAPIETQALMIEVYDEVANDIQSVEALKVWLLKQKQTTDWRTTKATAEACYALLKHGVDLLASDKQVEIKVGKKLIDPRAMDDTNVEAGTGYFKTSWTASEITPAMAEVTVTKRDQGVAWGAVYWQYFEQLDKITFSETSLRLKKQLFISRDTDRGPVIVPVNETNVLKVGDLVKVRIEIRSDRDLEYVHLKDMRAAAFEPVTTLSGYKYQDGLGYYESPRDLATHFFISRLSKGTYVFEYDLRVSQVGDFSNGVTTIQCMYAPEFTSHSEGVRVQVK